MFGAPSAQVFSVADRVLADLGALDATDQLAEMGCAMFQILGALRERFAKTPEDQAAFDRLCSETQAWLRAGDRGAPVYEVAFSNWGQIIARRLLTVNPGNDPMWVPRNGHPFEDQRAAMIVRNDVPPPEPGTVTRLTFFGDAPEEAERAAKAALGLVEPGN